MPRFFRLLGNAHRIPPVLRDYRHLIRNYHCIEYLLMVLRVYISCSVAVIHGYNTRYLFFVSSDCFDENANGMNDVQVRKAMLTAYDTW
jgi:hypothetical protein